MLKLIAREVAPKPLGAADASDVWHHCLDFCAHTPVYMTTSGRACQWVPQGGAPTCLLAGLLVLLLQVVRLSFERVTDRVQRCRHLPAPEPRPCNNRLMACIVLDACFIGTYIGLY